MASGGIAVVSTNAPVSLPEARRLAEDLLPLRRVAGAQAVPDEDGDQCRGDAERPQRRGRIPAPLLAPHQREGHLGVRGDLVLLFELDRLGSGHVEWSRVNGYL